MPSIKDQLAKFAKSIIKEIGSAQGAVTKTAAIGIGQETVKQMKELIAVGKSPIKSKGRFPGYKRANEPDGYPANQRGNFPGKRNRPVNLTLSGDFLRDLSAQAVKKAKGWVPVVYYKTTLSKQKERGHAEGAGGQPKRPTIPANQRDFTAAIFQRNVAAYKEIISKALKKR